MNGERRWCNGQHGCLPSSRSGFNSRLTHLFLFFTSCFSLFCNVSFSITRAPDNQQSGAVEACWAHNPEVRGSKPRPAMYIFFFFLSNLISMLNKNLYPFLFCFWSEIIISVLSLMDLCSKPQPKLPCSVIPVH